MFQSSSLVAWNHVHPVLVHFTTALLPVSLASDVAGKLTDRYSLTPAAWWMLFYGAIATPLTAIAGWMWASDIGTAGSAFGSLLTTHRWLGLGLFVAMTALAVWRGRTFGRSEKPGAPYLAFALLVCLLLFYQGFTGGKMTLG